ncbi:chorismate mutase [Palleronia rufa]|uniref:chorismate mutase n=1 Tax=Palleronia rufa TaxID=1530186 RepID=UPI00055EC83D|nr:chorismate mutase [Palleronia rufa]
MSDLSALRDRIDQLDAILVHTLAERFRQTARVGALKAAEGLPPRDADRESAQRARIDSLAKDAGLDPEFARKIHGLIVDQVKENHRKISGDQ